MQLRQGMLGVMILMLSTTAWAEIHLSSGVETALETGEDTSFAPTIGVEYFGEEVVLHIDVAFTLQEEEFPFLPAPHAFLFYGQGNFSIGSVGILHAHEGEWSGTAGLVSGWKHGEWRFALGAATQQIHQETENGQEEAVWAGGPYALIMWHGSAVGAHLQVMAASHNEDTLWSLHFGIHAEFAHFDLGEKKPNKAADNHHNHDHPHAH